MSRDKVSATREIKARISIVELVRRYVDLRRVGNRWVAPCPFHQETKPSFSVNEEEGFFYCFGCQAAGDIFDFHGRINGLEFKESLEQLAEEAGVLVTDARPTPEAAAGRDFRKQALAMHEVAKKHFQTNLGAKAGANCRAYLEGRKLDPAIIERFELGWSLPEWRGLADTMRRAGFSPGQGVDAGLLAGNERGSGYDRFRGRLIFPIKNLSGQVIAFGGRIIGDEDAAKYINSADSPLYKKGDNLYGLFQARRGIAAKKAAILTEGYMDVLTLHQFGYDNACGVLGTALTVEQVHRLAGFCSELELIFDGDAPGRKAALKACEMVLAKGLACKVVALPDKEDIDSLLHGQGVEAFENLRRFSPEGLDFCIRMLSVEAPREALDWVKRFLASVEQPELLTRYVSRLAHGLDIDERELRKGLGRAGSLAVAPAPAPAVPVQKDAFERELMKFVVRCPWHLPVLRESGATLLLGKGFFYSLWEKVADCAPEFDPDDVYSRLDGREKAFWGRYRVVEAPPGEHQKEELSDICTEIERRCRERQSGACMHALRQSGGKNELDYELLKAVMASLPKE